MLRERALAPGCVGDNNNNKVNFYRVLALCQILCGVLEALFSSSSPINANGIPIL